MTLKLLAIGEAMAELRQSTRHQYKVGFAGDSYNTAVYCSRMLGVGGAVGFLSRVGNDPLSESFLDLAAAEGLVVDHIERDQNANIGIYSVTTDAHGERSFHYWRNSSAARYMFKDNEAALTLPDASIVYLSGITLAILEPSARERLMDCLRHASASGKFRIAFDSNYRPSLWESTDIARHIISQMWGMTDIALPSLDDEILLFGESGEAAVIARFAAYDHEACAIKRGDRGPVSPKRLTDDTPLVFRSADTVVDTTAAGDSFNGAYLANLLAGKSESDCLLAGHACASRVVGFKGAIIPADQF